MTQLPPLPMDNPRTYGPPPYPVAVLHGGPGAPGPAAPLARALASYCGVLEPLQTADSIAGQVEELRQMLERHAHTPVTLIGHSWGALLALLFAAEHPSLIQRLILVGCPPLEDRYAAAITTTRLARLPPDQRAEAQRLLDRLASPSSPDDPGLARLAALFLQADCVAPLSLDTETIAVQPRIFQSVWGQAATLRRQSKLPSIAQHISCPTLAIHGADDPHPVDDVRLPLASLPGFRCLVLPRCGHYPWLERHARDRFFTILQQELSYG